MPMWRAGRTREDGGLIRCGGGGWGVSNRAVQMQYRYSTATALSSWDAYAGRSIREGERGVRAANKWVCGLHIGD